MENEVRTLRSMRLTLFVCTVMVWGWGYIILNNIEGLAFALAALLPVLVALPLLLLTLRFTTRLRGLTGPKLFANRRVIWLYMAGLVVTVVGFVLAQVIARALHHAEYAIPGATLAVGLHFLFLALAFRAQRDYLTLAVFCLASLFVPLAVPLKMTLGPLATSNNGGSWMVVTGMIGLVWLWLVAAYLLVLGGRRLREIKGSGSKWAERGRVG
jgi:hypothetical protein